MVSTNAWHLTKISLTFSKFQKEKTSFLWRAWGLEHFEKEQRNGFSASDKSSSDTAITFRTQFTTWMMTRALFSQGRIFVAFFILFRPYFQCVYMLLTRANNRHKRRCRQKDESTSRQHYQLIHSTPRAPKTTPSTRRRSKHIRKP